MHSKGSVGGFLKPCTNADLGGVPGPKVGKCSIKLSFDEVDPEARFYGLKKLNLHSMNQDPSMMRDRLAYAMFRENGVPASRAVHARVMFNGKLQGLFIAVEQVDGRFTRSRFTEGGKGNLYKEIWPMHTDAAAYTNALVTNEDQMPSVQRMLDFHTAIGTGNAGVDSIFGGQSAASCDPLIKVWNGWSTDYESAVDAFLAGPFAKAHVDELLNAWETQISTAVMESSGLNSAPTVMKWQTETTNLQNAIHAMREHRGYAY